MSINLTNSITLSLITLSQFKLCRIVASLVTAGSGTSLKTKCSALEPILHIIFLILTGIGVSLAKLFAPGGFKKNFGPTVVSFLMMFATGLALHQKPLICG